ASHFSVRCAWQNGRPRKGSAVAIAETRARRAPSFDLFLDVEDLATAIHTGLEVDVMRTAQLTGILVFNIGCGGKGVGRAAEAALHRRGLAFWHCHGRYSEFNIVAPPERPREFISEGVARLYRASEPTWLGAFVSVAARCEYTPGTSAAGIVRDETQHLGGLYAQHGFAPFEVPDCREPLGRRTGGN